MRIDWSKISLVMRAGLLSPYVSELKFLYLPNNGGGGTSIGGLRDFRVRIREVEVVEGVGSFPLRRGGGPRLARLGHENLKLGVG